MIKNMPDAIQAARLKLVRERPYLASAAWALIPIEKKGLKTMAVDEYWRLYYDPEVENIWNVEEIKGVLYHEITHLLRNHAERMKNNFEPYLANIATDAEINDDLQRENISLPSQPITPESIGCERGLFAEEYYAALLELQAQQLVPQRILAQQKSKNSQSNPASTPGKGQVQNNGQLDSKGDASDSDSKDRDSNSSVSSKTDSLSKSEASSQLNPTPGLGHEKDADNMESNSEAQTPMPGSGSCGSCATGHKAKWEDEIPTEKSNIISKTEAELIRRNVAKQIKTHYTARGNIPQHWRRWADEKLKTKVNWQGILASTIRHTLTDISGTVDYSYKKPSRRQSINNKVILPSLRSPLPSIVVIVDTSGSITDKMLDQYLAEINGILKAVGQKENITVISCDAAVHTCKKIFKTEQIELLGGGGTDMGKGLKVVEKIKPRPSLSIVLTDGNTPWPELPPKNMKVVVALTEENQVPSWAKKILIKGE